MRSPGKNSPAILFLTNKTRFDAMKIKLFSITSAFLAVAATTSSAQVSVTAKKGIELSALTIYYASDETVVKKTAELLASDIGMVTGKTPEVKEFTGENLSKEAIIVGTAGRNSGFTAFASKHKLPLSELREKWESYLVAMLDRPAPGCNRAIVVVGSDRRGTAYGTFSISEAIGVSPWYWWADAPVPRQPQLRLTADLFIAPEPSVRYRGIFINDEDWGLLRWARETFEPERKNIGPATYEKVCELLLRLKANYLCPAMHEASTAFNAIAENKIVADNYAIVMGSVHCEPLLFNNASEWKRETMGEWDYTSNKDGINSVLRKRVQENHHYENIYTLALRGLHDVPMTGSSDMGKRVEQLQGALMDQRQIVEDVTGRPADEIPQAFTPYKEVLDVYQSGLQLPDDVTIVWPDDNYGYMKQLSSPRERQRRGRSGVYYHASYLGRPHDYLWISSTPPALMYEELRKAYDATADRIWLLNAGDIKGCERAVDLFLAMAYDIDVFDYHNIATYEARWLSGIYGSRYYDRLFDITTTFYDLAFSRKPELMGWGYQWATDKHGRERTSDTEFSFANYREAERRLESYGRIGKMVQEIIDGMDGQNAASFFQMIYYPVRGAEYLNRMILAGQKNRWYAAQGRAAANPLRNEAKTYYDSLEMITKTYNSLLDGRWNHVMTTRQGWAASYFELPRMDSVVLSPTPQPALWAEGQDVLNGVSSFHALPSFNVLTKQTYVFDIFNRGEGMVKWHAVPSQDWIRLSASSGSTEAEDRITVDLDWGKVPEGENIQGWIDVRTNERDMRVLVSVYNPEGLEVENGMWVEDNGCVAIPAWGFHRAVEDDEIQMTVIENLGFEGRSIMLGHPLGEPQRTGARQSPCLEYDFWAVSRGTVDVYTYMLPTFAVSSERSYAGHESYNIETKYGVAIDEGPVMNPTTSSFEYAQNWYESVLRNCRINKTTLYVDSPGKHTLKIICGDQGLVFQKAVLDFGGMKRSYMGPRPLRKE